MYILNTSSDDEAEKDMKTKANDLDRLMSLLKEKIDISKRSDKIQLLTLVPTSWTYKRIVEEFSVTKYMVRCARKLLSEKGILATTEPKRGYPISKELIDLVVEFYSNDEFSRMMPGKKDYVSIGKNNHVQKRLILSNLKEMYTMFKEEHSDKNWFFKILQPSTKVVHFSWSVRISFGLRMYHTSKCAVIS